MEWNDTIQFGFHGIDVGGANYSLPLQEPLILYPNSSLTLNIII